MLRTPKQRKVLCRDCHVARTADLVGDSVSILIVRDLLLRPRRFGDFEMTLAGVSSRTIANKLKKLEQDGLVQRDVSKRILPRGEYRLTPKGRALRSVVESMRIYGKKYL